MFATTPGHSLCFFYLFDDRPEFRPFMRTVAIRLIAAVTTGTPGVITWFDGHNIRTFLGNFLLRHKASISIELSIFQFFGLANIYALKSYPIMTWLTNL